MIWRQLEQSEETEEEGEGRALPLNPEGCSFAPFCTILPPRFGVFLAVFRLSLEAFNRTVAPRILHKPVLFSGHSFNYSLRVSVAVLLLLLHMTSLALASLFQLKS